MAWIDAGGSSVGSAAPPPQTPPTGTGPRVWDPTQGPPPGYTYTTVVDQQGLYVTVAGPLLQAPNGTMFYYKVTVPADAAWDPQTLAESVRQATPQVEAASSGVQKLYAPSSDGGATASSSGGVNPASWLNAITGMRALEEYQIPSLELEKRKFEEYTLPSLAETERNDAFSRLNAAVAAYLKAQADADARRLDAIRTTLAALPYAIPPDMKYIPGHEPGGPLDWISQQIGVGFTPIPTTPVTLNTQDLSNPAALPPEIAQQLQQMFGQAQ